MIALSYKPFLATGGNPSRSHLLSKAASEARGRLVPRQAGPGATCAGFTIIELLVAIGILGIVAGVGVQIFLTVSKSFAKAQIVSELQQEGSRVMAEMSRVIRDSKAVEKITVGDVGIPPCAAGDGMLKITLNKDSLEYRNNGGCEGITFCKVIAVGGPPTNNNYIFKKLGSCQGTAVGAGELTNKDVNAGLDVEVLNFEVIGGSGQPYLVNINLKLKQGLNVPQRKIYEAEVEIKNSVSTRNF